MCIVSLPHSSHISWLITRLLLSLTNAELLLICAKLLLCPYPSLCQEACYRLLHYLTLIPYIHLWKKLRQNYMFKYSLITLLKKKKKNTFCMRPGCTPHSSHSLSRTYPLQLWALANWAQRSRPLSLTSWMSGLPWEKDTAPAQWTRFLPALPVE